MIQNKYTRDGNIGHTGCSISKEEGSANQDETLREAITHGRDFSLLNTTSSAFTRLHYHWCRFKMEVLRSFGLNIKITK